VPSARLAIGVNAVFVIGASVSLLQGLGVADSLAQPPAYVFAAAAALYALSHLLRYGRLLVLLMERQPTYGSLLAAHFISAWVSALLPFRIGEFYRLFKLSETSGSWRHGVAAYGVEKFLDAAFLLAFVVITLAVGAPGQPLVVLLVAMTSVVVLSIALYVLAEGSLAYAGRALLLWGRSARSLWALRLVAQGRELHVAVRSTVQQRGLPLLALTLAIWLLDFLAFSLLAGVFVSGADASHWSGFLAALQETLDSASTPAGGSYQSLVVVLLSFVALICIVAGMVAGAPRWLAQRRRARPYHLVSARESESHG
jgi:hypothetical protein